MLSVVAYRPADSRDESSWSIFITLVLCLNQNRHIPITPCKPARRFPECRPIRRHICSVTTTHRTTPCCTRPLLFSRVYDSFLHHLIFFSSLSLRCELNISICSKCVCQVYIAKHIKMNGLPLRDHCDFECGVGI